MPIFSRFVIALRFCGRRGLGTVFVDIKLAAIELYLCLAAGEKPFLFVLGRDDFKAMVIDISISGFISLAIFLRYLF